MNPWRIPSRVSRTAGSSVIVTASERSFRESGTSGSVMRSPSARAIPAKGSAGSAAAAASRRERIRSACSSRTAVKSSSLPPKCWYSTASEQHASRAMSPTLVPW